MPGLNRFLRVTPGGLLVENELGELAVDLLDDHLRTGSFDVELGAHTLRWRRDDLGDLQPGPSLEQVAWVRQYSNTGLGRAAEVYRQTCRGATLGEGLAVRGAEAAQAGPEVGARLRRAGLLELTVALPVPPHPQCLSPRLRAVY